MGVKGLNEIIQCFIYIPKEKFRNQKVALDFLNFYFCCHSKACKEEIINLPIALLLEGKHSEENIFKQGMKLFMNDLFSFLRFGIIPVTIFEGKAFPQKEPYAGTRRRKDRERLKERLLIAEKLIQNNLANEKDITSYKNLYAQNIHFDRNKVVNEIKWILDSVGLPYLTCLTEAEHLGTALCKEGYVMALYTTDTDVLPLACPCVISREGTEEDPMSPVFKTVRYKEILESLKLTKKQFVDICILSSCDYNERVKMKGKNGKEKSIGIKTALKLVREYSSLENILANDMIIGKEKLEIDDCKNIFRGFSVEELCSGFNEDLLVHKIKEEEIKEERYENLKIMKFLVEQIPPIPNYEWSSV